MPYQQFTLPNGLDVLCEETGSGVIGVQLRFNHGAYSERPGEEGLTHLLEHVMMEGATRAWTKQKRKQIRNQFQYSNAFTSHSEIVIEGNTLTEKGVLLLKSIAEAGFFHRIDAQTLTEQQAIVTREMLDQAPDTTDSNVTNMLYGRELARPVIGFKEIVEQATVGKLRTIQQRGLAPANATLFIVGSLPANIEGVVHDCFGPATSRTFEATKLPEKKPFAQTQHIITYGREITPSDSSAYLALHSIGAATMSAEGYALVVLANLADKRVHDVLRNERGFVYRANTGASAMANKVLVTTETAIAASRTDEAIDIILTMYDKFKRERVSKKDLEKVATGIEYHLRVHDRTDEARMSALVNFKKFDVEPGTQYAAYGSVTPEQIIEAARKYLPSDRTGPNLLITEKRPVAQR